MSSAARIMRLTYFKGGFSEASGSGLPHRPGSSVVEHPTSNATWSILTCAEKDPSAFTLAFTQSLSPLAGVP